MTGQRKSPMRPRSKVISCMFAIVENGLVVQDEIEVDERPDADSLNERVEFLALFLWIDVCCMCWRMMEGLSDLWCEGCCRKG
jgi:hypothetical protein